MLGISYRPTDFSSLKEFSKKKKISFEDFHNFYKILSLCALALAISVYKEILAALTLHPLKILGIFLCMVFLIDLLTLLIKRVFKKNQF